MKNSSIDLFDFQDAPYALQTYYCYVRAWAGKIRHLYGQQPKCFDGLKNAMMAKKSGMRKKGQVRYLVGRNRRLRLWRERGKIFKAGGGLNEGKSYFC